MKASITTFVIGVGILLALIALTFGIWFYPGIALLALVLVPLGACLSEKKSDKLSRRHGRGSTQSATFRQTPVGGGEHREFREPSVRKARLAHKVSPGILGRQVRLLWAA